MKAFILALSLITSFSASAQMVFVQPLILNLGNMVQVQIRNTNDFDITCSGPVMMTTTSGRMETATYVDWIPRFGFSVRSFYLSNFNDRVMFTNHSIFCYKR